MKNKIKGKFEEHKTLVAYVAGGLVTVGALVLGFQTGMRYGGVGIYGTIVNANPDLAQPINEAINKVIP